MQISDLLTRIKDYLLSSIGIAGSVGLLFGFQQGSYSIDNSFKVARAMESASIGLDVSCLLVTVSISRSQKL